MAERTGGSGDGLGGAGRGGGVLFLAVLAFVAYQAVTGLGGGSRVVVVALLLAAMLALGVNVAQRR